MGGWSLEYLHNLPAGIYDELIAWINDDADRAKHGEVSIDMDAPDRHGHD